MLSIIPYSRLAKAKVISLLLVLLLQNNVFSAKDKNLYSPPEVRLIKLAELQALLAANPKTLHIVNFWATWCKPCLEELPYFEEVRKVYANKEITFIYVSLDFPEHLTRVKLLAEEKSLGGTVVLLDESDQDAFINAIDESWSGAIPATLFFRKYGKIREFHEGTFTKVTLQHKLENLLDR